MDVKKALNFASWGLFAVGVFFILSSTRTAFIVGIGMVLLGIVLQSIFYYFKKDNKEDIDNTP